ncbi:hypothetical protein CPBF367_07300 [Xanthomonas arboricola pv. juglandis]|uniref:Uncharacterized protein n=1 Tax=Xanthomonas euroxanthea TaxID=2259622 RepID=A0AA46C5Y1_9XANT|nr:hypothetical protein CPBF424_07540 [Xanthomonas euroxanthea]SYZ51936.1 hypothetical protein CPBF367_07300 [Xanthomonas arboricola pv. juglandis]
MRREQALCGHAPLRAAAARSECNAAAVMKARYAAAVGVAAPRAPHCMPAVQSSGRCHAQA